MGGRLIYLMGPSGSGKDTVLQGLCHLMGNKARIAPRLITRPETCTERGAISVSEAEFLNLELSGRLAMSWRANGLAYGVPIEIDDMLNRGWDVLVNGSRDYLPEARKRYRNLLPVLLVVETELLRQRLSARGREDQEQIRQRLERNARFETLAVLADAGSILALDNSGPVEDTVQALYNYLTADVRQYHATDTTWNGQRAAGSRL